MSKSVINSDWFARWNPTDQCRLRLFCFPYAGGSPLAFRAWPKHLPSGVEICPVLLPGRVSRINEPPLTSFPAVVEQIALAIRPYLDRPFAFFGHSLGALIGFELARHLAQENSPQPVHFFASGCRAPNIPNPHPLTHMLPVPEFLERLQSLNGTPPEVLADEELMRLMMPLLRADFELAETYCYSDGPPLNFSISVYGGLHDKEVEREHLEAWREQTNTGFVLRMLDGGHFFLHQAETVFLQTLTSELVGITRALS